MSRQPPKFDLAAILESRVETERRTFGRPSAAVTEPEVDDLEVELDLSEESGKSPPSAALVGRAETHDSGTARVLDVPPTRGGRAADDSGTARVLDAPPTRTTRPGARRERDAPQPRRHELSDSGSSARVLDAPPTRHTTPRPRPRSADASGSGTRPIGALRQVRLLPGRRVPGTRYRLVRWLGEGGMGVVYEAEHEDIERRVALKILRPEASDDPTLAARFREEARAASRIGSPNIVEIFDFDELPDGRLMIAMELLTGLGLDTELEAGPLAQERVIAVLRQVAKGLAAAHDVGIVHRDVKPDNVILLTEGGRSDYAKLVDFGIATVMTAQDNDAGAGTPHFMAPELILGRSYDGRLDMYALGCMAYELLIGEPPFMMGSVEEILEAQVSLAPRSILEVRPDACHPALEAVILRCLAKDPSERYADMRDLEAALCEAQIAAGLTTPWDDLPLPAVEPERLERLRRLMPRPDDAPRGRRWLWPAIAGLSSTLAALVTFSLFSADPTNEEEAQIKALQDAAHEFGARANWVYPPHDDTRATALLKVIELEAIDGAAEELADERASSLRQEFADALVELGDLYWDEEGGRPFARDYYAQAYLFDRANDHAYERTGMTLGELADLREKAESGTFSAEDIRAAAALAILAERDAEKRDQLAAAFIEEEPDNPIGRDARFRKITGRSKPRVIAQREAPREPEDELEDAPPATKKVSAPETKSTPESTRPTKDPKKARSLAKDGAAALARGSRRDAESLFHQALESDNSNAAALIGLSDIAFDRSRYSEAIKFAARATRVEPGNGGYRIKLGDAYFKALRYKEAREQYEKAQSLGHPEAKGRLSKLRAKLGQ